MIQLYYSKDCLLFDLSLNEYLFRFHILSLILYIWSSVALQQFKMEEVIFRFPQLAERIFQNLEPKSCVKCTLVGRKWKTFLEKENFYFFKIVKAFTKCTTKSLKKIHSHSSLSSISKFASDVVQLYGKCKEKGKINPYYDEFVNWEDKGLNWTAFHKAAEDGHLSICQLIIENSENKNPRDKNGWTPLHIAAAKGHLSTCGFIIKNVANKNPECIIGKTPLHCAAVNGHLSTCHLLIKNSDDKNPKDNTGMTPLHWAATHGHIQICKLIMKKVPNKNPTDNTGFTPLHSAAMCGHISICKFFIEELDDNNPEDFMGRTPQHFAQQYGHWGIVQLFESVIGVLGASIKDNSNFAGFLTPPPTPSLMSAVPFVNFDQFLTFPSPRQY